jgi:APA family basic amino acid/polyamine antiporter
MTGRTADRALEPTIGLYEATAISVGAIIGSGIFVVTGIAAGAAGSAVILSMAIAGAVSLLTALSIAELAAWLPREGSVYELAYRLLSPVVGFLAGWMWVLSNIFGGAAVALGFAYYVTVLAPKAPTQAIAVAICLVLTILNYAGLRQTGMVNGILVMAKLAVLAFFCGFGLLYVRGSNFEPFEPLRAGVLYGAGYIFFAYSGFARVSVIAEEVRDAARTVPRAILLSLGISTVVYIGVGMSAVGLVGASRLASSNSPLAEAMRATGHGSAVVIVAFGGLVATASVLLTSILGVSRMTYAMARRADVPAALAKLDPKRGTPDRAVWISGMSMVALVLLVNLRGVVAISSFATLFYYAVANLCALRLRVESRVYPRAIPALGAVACLGLLGAVLFISPAAWAAGVGGLVCGCVYYVGRRWARSRSSTARGMP